MLVGFILSAIVITLVTVVYSCIVISSRCSRLEEQEMLNDVNSELHI